MSKMNLEHLVIPESKKAINDDKGHVKRLRNQLKETPLAKDGTRRTSMRKLQ